MVKLNNESFKLIDNISWSIICEKILLTPKLCLSELVVAKIFNSQVVRGFMSPQKRN